MSNFRSEKDYSELKHKVLHAAVKLFLEKGYSNATTREIAKAAQVNVSTMNRCFGSKENILADLVGYVLESQFSVTEKLLEGVTEDKILLYAAETTLQLYMTESDEHIRELYAAAYSMPNTSNIIQHTITGKLEMIFKEQLPDLETKDFYKLEIASGGIMRGFMTIPCTMWFTMDQKVASFLECTFKIYDVSKEKIQEAIMFVQQFDYPTIARNTVHSMVEFLDAAGKQM